MSPERALVDTNVLVYAVSKAAPQYTASRALLERVQSGSQPLAVAPQNLLEFYATVTSPRRVTVPVSPREALNLMDEILRIRHLIALPCPADLHERWRALVESHPVGGKKAFDLQLVACMLAAGVRRIFTYNTADFRIFPGIEAVEP